MHFSELFIDECRQMLDKLSPLDIEAAVDLLVEVRKKGATL